MAQPPPPLPRAGMYNRGGFATPPPTNDVEDVPSWVTSAGAYNPSEFDIPQAGGSGGYGGGGGGYGGGGGGGFEAPAAPSQSNAQFTGVFSLRSQGEVDQLTMAVRNLVEKGVNIFYLLDRSAIVGELTANIRTIVNLSGTFPSLCLDADSKMAANAVVDSMAASMRQFEQATSGHMPGQKLGENACKDVAAAIRNLLSKTAELTDLMEENQIQRGIRIVKQAFNAIMLLKDVRSMYGLDQNANHAERAMSTLEKLLENRVNVTDEMDQKRELIEMSEIVKTYTPELMEASRQKAQDPDAPAAKERHAVVIKKLALTMKRLLDMLQSRSLSIAGQAGFSYDRLAQALDALDDAVRSGSSGMATQQAKGLVDELKKLQNAATLGSQNEADRLAREELERAGRALGDSIARLVNATKGALTDSSSSMQMDFSSCLQDVKGQVEVLKPMVTPRARNSALKDTLLTASKNLTSGMENMLDTI
eukprot:TRINITY_DN4517_c1_g2_i1.p1 TRINITY_DN4517_c1_g2~~TRINITY_DN4517_c1_g2_i1.p1  ORF type:complete len:478 (+),score=158.31 TRINITY_DN4517_c1_g2_i1:130-1563(+)